MKKLEVKINSTSSYEKNEDHPNFNNIQDVRIAIYVREKLLDRGELSSINIRDLVFIEAINASSDEIAWKIYLEHHVMLDSILSNKDKKKVVKRNGDIFILYRNTRDCSDCKWYVKGTKCEGCDDGSGFSAKGSLIY